MMGKRSTSLLLLLLTAVAPAAAFVLNHLQQRPHSSGNAIVAPSLAFNVALAMSEGTQQRERTGYAGRGAGRGGGRGGGGGRRNDYQSRGGGRGGRGGRGGGARGGGASGGSRDMNDYSGPVLELQNPMKLQRIQQPREQRQEREGGEGRGGGRGGRGGGGRGAGEARGGAGRSSVRPTAGDRGGAPSAGGDDFGGGSSLKGPGRNPLAKKVKPGARSGRSGRGGDDERGERVSLRVGTGKKGRQTEVKMRRGSLRKKDRSREKAEKEERALERRTVYLPGTPMTVGDLAEAISETPVSVIKFLMTDLGIMAAVSQTLDPSTCEAVADGFGKVVAGEDDEEYDDDEDMEESALESGVAWDEDDPEDLVFRPPVVTIMGHVDHGKTSLLDAIRNTRVTAGEAGGITQHIAAYQVEHDGSQITFIDTPGHAAFTDMRERGANTADMIILVVAADDSVKQQTADSIACARQAGVPLLVAVNKIDLPTADVNRVLADLAGYEVLTEDLGGEVLCSQISAKEGTNLDDLLSKVMLQAEILDLKANPNRDAQGVVIEARVEKGLGTVATTLIQKGTIRIGDSFVAGEASGKVRALIGYDGKTRYKEAGPSTPINVVGFNGVPAAGDILVVAEDEQTAREIAAARARIARERQASSYQSGLMKSVAGLFSGGQKEIREICVVVKADVQGSAEALSRSLSDLKLENDEVQVKIKVLVGEAGDVTKSDIAVASVTPGTTVIAFNTGANQAAMDDARALGVPIEYYSVVYDAIESVESRMQEVLSPTPEGEYVGSAIVQEVFNIGGTGNIAGSKCRDGIIKKGSNVRVLRGDKILTESKVKTLRNFKAEVDTITTGDECGIGLLNYEDFEVGDIIESYVVK
ncbi:hypothetical protein ACHAW6_014860 [Cyclotella cf. meneghiniana]